MQTSPPHPPQAYTLNKQRLQKNRIRIYLCPTERCFPGFPNSTWYSQGHPSLRLALLRRVPESVSLGYSIIRGCRISKPHIVMKCSWTLQALKKNNRYWRCYKSERRAHHSYPVLGIRVLSLKIGVFLQELPALGFTLGY